MAFWGTILIDIYRSDQRKELCDALEELCSPLDNMNFASAGVYAFWRPRGGEVFYVGLARDIPQRYAQHNGLVKFLPSGCKLRQIERHFEVENTLGFSAIVQSPLSQPWTHRLLSSFGTTWREVGDDDASESEFAELRELEARLLKAHLLTHGRLPAWNSIGGSRKAADAVGADDQTLDAFTGRLNTLLQARRPAREVAENHLLAHLETWLHGARLQGFVRYMMKPYEDLNGQVFEAIFSIDEGPMRERDMIRSVQYLHRHPFDDLPPVDFPKEW